MKRFTHEKMATIRHWLMRTLHQRPAGFTVDMQVLDPDISDSHYAGELIDFNGVPHVYRPLKTWVEVAESVGGRLQTPHGCDDGYLRLTIRLLNANHSWHLCQGRSGAHEKYGADSEFQRIHKFEDPIFSRDFSDALDFLQLSGPMRVLNIGVNRGDELLALYEWLASARIHGVESVGIDHSQSAIELARQRLSDLDVTLVAADIRQLDPSEMGDFHLIIGLNVLQSPDLDGHATLRMLMRKMLKPSGRILLGFPNDRYIDHQQVYGARVKNYRTAELSILIKDVMAYRRYLCQQGFVVKTTGKNTILLSARPDPSRRAA
ncbi:MAG: class I SAM-dependent methyltransferase [Myxococcota bacterium]|nr:class I SAM-dependent methyltransferase [Myxococcota bacterium]